MKISNPVAEGQALRRIIQTKEGNSPNEIHSPQIIQQGVLPGYKTDFSTEDRDIRSIFDALAATPDWRMSKVEALRQAIEMGRYEISGEILAVKMIKESAGG